MLNEPVKEGLLAFSKERTFEIKFTLKKSGLGVSNTVVRSASVRVPKCRGIHYFKAPLAICFPFGLVATKHFQ